MLMALAFISWLLCKPVEVLEIVISQNMRKAVLSMPTPEAQRVSKTQKLWSERAAECYTLFRSHPPMM